MSISPGVNRSLLVQIIIVPVKTTIQYWEQSINNIILLKQYVKSIPPVPEALANARSDLLGDIRRVGPTQPRSQPRTDSGTAVHPRDDSGCREIDR